MCITFFFFFFFKFHCEGVWSAHLNFWRFEPRVAFASSFQFDVHSDARKIDKYLLQKQERNNCNWFCFSHLFVDATAAVVTAAVDVVELFSIHIKRTAVDRVSLMQNSCSQQIEQNKCWRLDSDVHMWVCGAVDVRQPHAYSTYVSTITTCAAKLKTHTTTHWHCRTHFQIVYNRQQSATASTCTRDSDRGRPSSFSMLRVIRTETHRTICCSFRIWPQTKAQIP